MSDVTFFSNAAGRVVAFEDSGLPSVAAVSVSGFGGFTQTRSIITRVGFSGSANASFKHTVGGAVHIYTFGDRIGEAVISGLCFDSGCESNEFSGLEQIVDYYNRNRVSERGSPITITCGARLSLLAYLISVTCDVAETTSRVYQYSFKLVLVPSPLRQYAGGGGAGEEGPLFGPLVTKKKKAGKSSTSPVEVTAADLGITGGMILTPPWTSVPISDKGGAIQYPYIMPYQPTPGWASVNTGPKTLLTKGFN